MGNYLGKKKPNPNLIDESGGNGANNQNLYGQHSDEQIARSKKTVYRPQIFIDYYKSKLFKVTLLLLSFCVELELKDNDGSVANEFWVQCPDNGKVKKDKKIRSVGYEEYDPPRLAHSFKYVLCENSSLGF